MTWTGRFSSEARPNSDFPHQLKTVIPTAQIKSTVAYINVRFIGHFTLRELEESAEAARFGGVSQAVGPRVSAAATAADSDLQNVRREGAPSQLKY